ncbi:MAG: SHOCT domain-containing protein [Candidatus Saccharimonadales bacterium]
MGLFDKIKDNARDLSMKAIDATREYVDEEPAQGVIAPSAAPAAVPKPAAKKTVPEAAEEEQVPVGKILSDVEEAFEAEALEVTAPEEELPAGIKLPEAVVTKPEKPASAAKPKQDEPQTGEASNEDSGDDSEAEGYVPYYKQKPNSGKKPSEATKPPKPTANVDVKPQKVTDPEKRAMLSRERTAIIELANQRRMEGKTPLFTTSHLNFKIRVYVDRVEYSGTFGKTVLPVNQIAWIRLRHGGTGVILETVGEKKVVMVVSQRDRLALADAVMKMQALVPTVQKFKDNKTVRLDVLEKATEDVDDIERIAKLYKRGLITKEEFELKKKQILKI